MAVDLDDRLGQPLVGTAAVRSDQLVGERLAGQCVPEDVRRRHAVAELDQELQAQPLLDDLLDRLEVETAGLGEDVGVEPVGGQSGQLQDREAVAAERTRPGQQRLAHRDGHLDLGEVAALPVVLTLVDVAALDQDLGQLLDEERVPARALDDEIGEVVAHLRAVEHAGEHRADVLAGQRLERDLRGPALAAQLGEDREQGVAPVHLVGAVGGHDEDRQVGQLTGQVGEHPQAVLVGPVNVLEQQHPAPRPVEAGEQVPDGGRQVLGGRVGGREGDHRRDLRQQRGCQHRGPVELRHELVSGQVPGAAPDGVHERPVRDGRVGRALADQRQETVGGGEVHDF